MVANLILEAAGTAGMLAAEVTKKPDASNQEKKRTMLQSAIQGPKRVISLLNTIAGKSGILGINLSVSSILRQGQAFTAMVSTLFQLAGAFLDLAFAPLIPGIARMLKDLAGKIPGYADFIETVSTRIVKTFEVYKLKYDPDEVWPKLISSVTEVVADAIDDAEDSIWNWWMDRWSSEIISIDNIVNAILSPFILAAVAGLNFVHETIALFSDVVDPDAEGIPKFIQELGEIGVPPIIGVIGTALSDLKSILLVQEEWQHTLDSAVNSVWNWGIENPLRDLADDPILKRLGDLMIWLAGDRLQDSGDTKILDTMLDEMTRRNLPLLNLQDEMTNLITQMIEFLKPGDTGTTLLDIFKNSFGLWGDIKIREGNVIQSLGGY